MDRWYEPADGLSLDERLRRPIVSHAPPEATIKDAARDLVDDRSDSLVEIITLRVRVAELEEALRCLIDRHSHGRDHAYCSHQALMDAEHTLSNSIKT